MKFLKFTKWIGAIFACLFLSVIMMFFMSAQIETFMQINLDHVLFRFSRYLVYCGVILLMPYFLFHRGKLDKPQVKRLRYSLLIMAAVYELLVWSL